MLVQPPSVLIGDTFSELYIQRDDANLVGVAVHRESDQWAAGHLLLMTYMTSLLSRSGTISSTNVFGVLPCGVNPVEQF